MVLEINTGGNLSPEAVIGRDSLIASIWKTLEVQSVILSAERRMGKTSILKKMVAEPMSGFIPIYRDLEAIKSPEEFLEYLIQDMDEHLTAARKTQEWLKNAWKMVGGADVLGKFKVPNAPQFDWKTSLQILLREIAQNVEGRVVFLWDEMPLMLHNIKRVSGEKLAMEILDTFRAIRHDASTEGLRMVFTGSIGLHHVLTELRQAGYANKPVNDMQNILVPGLNQQYAYLLAEGLLEGIGITDSEARKQSAQQISEATDCIPFYIHHLVKRIRDYPEGKSEGVVNVAAIRSDLLNDPQDALDLKYYRERIKTYYSSEQQPIALFALDSLANTEPLIFADLLSRITLKNPALESEMLRDTISLLEQDHYLQRDSTGYGFQRRLVRDGWKALRGIA